MKITFLGAAKTVTGSCFLCETKNTSFLVDAGLFQGSAADRMLNEAPLSFDPSKIDFLLLTHAHIDHSGRIPLLVKKGFKGKIYSHKATVDLCEIMLPDSGYIQETETEWVNRKRIRAGLPTIDPLYTYMDAQKSLSYFVPVSYDRIIHPAPGIRVCFRDAGHILGSSIIEVWEEQEKGEAKIVFTGDLGKQNTAIIRDPSIIEEADWVIMESTYGNREHTEVENRSSKMASLITRTVRRGGNVIIPAFSVGRTQEMIYDINKNNAESEYFRAIINNTKTFIDSPLAINATSIFMENSDCYDEEAIAYLESGDDPLQFPGLTFTLSPEESKNINSYNKPCIIIAASGMCDAGRIKHHLKHNLWRHESTVIFVGYQAQGTLGRRILDGNKKVKIFGEVIDVNANIEKIDGFSAHADQKELLNWAAAFKRKPRKIFLVHGEPEVQEEFSKLIQNRLGIETLIPDRGDSFDLTKEQSVYMGVTQENRNINNDFKRLHLLDYLYDADEEISSVIQEVYDLLKTDISDIDVEKLLKKSKEIEQSIKAFKDTFSMYK
jgi:metallo-beta-lactamase family protein